MNNRDGRHEPWFALFEKAVAASSKTAVAHRLGISRSAVSLVMSDKYGAATDKIAARVLAVYSVVDCPYLAQAISQEDCAAHAGRAIPTSSPRAVRHWKACQTCPNRPQPQGSCPPRAAAELLARSTQQEETCKPQ